MSGRSAVWAAGLALALCAPARAQLSTDPLTGATVDPNAGLPAPPPSDTTKHEAIYFDADGNVVSDPSKASQYSISDGVQSSMPKPISEMTEEEKKQLGLDKAGKDGDQPEGEKADDDKPLNTDCKPGTPGCDLYGPPAPEPEARPATGDNKPANAQPWMIPGTEATDPTTGIEYATIAPEFAQAAQESVSAAQGFQNADGQSIRPAPSVEAPSRAPSGGPAGPAGPVSPNRAYIAPATQAQTEAFRNREAAKSGGYGAIGALADVFETVKAAIFSGAHTSAAGYGHRYDGSVPQPAIDDNVRSGDNYLGVEQQTNQ